MDREKHLAPIIKLLSPLGNTWKLDAEVSSYILMLLKGKACTSIKSQDQIISIHGRKLMFNVHILYQMFSNMLLPLVLSGNMCAV